MGMIRQSAVAGTFYPDGPRKLSQTVRGFLEAADAGDGPAPKAIVVPHAGYVYSGQVAARAYAKLAGARDTISRVVLLGPCHRVPVRGLALSGADVFLTPLGEVPVDKEAEERIRALPQVQEYEPTHALEHSLEVQIPFLQEALGDFNLVPIVVGEATPGEVAEVLDTLWGGPETLIVISSDLSHYLDYDGAKAIDLETCHAIESLNPDLIGDNQACGRFPLRGLLDTARTRHMRVETLDLRNSGDTAGPRDQVVGYGAWGLWENGEPS